MSAKSQSFNAHRLLPGRLARRRLDREGLVAAVRVRVRGQVEVEAVGLEERQPLATSEEASGGRAWSARKPLDFDGLSSDPSIL